MIKGLIKLTRVEDYYGSSLAVIAISVIPNPGLNFFDRGVMVIVILLLNIFAFAINDIEDAQDDAKDPSKVNRNPISAKVISRGVALKFTLIVALLSLLLLTRVGLTSTMFGLLTIIFGFLYSYKPIRLKSIPFLDVLSHGLFLGGFQSLVVITANNNQLNLLGASIAFLIFISSAVGDINNEIRDYEVDRKTNIKNTASVINLVRFKPITHFLSLVPYGGLALIVITYIKIPILLVLCALILIFAFVYIKDYALQKKRGFYDKYAQQLSALIGLILLATT